MKVNGFTIREHIRRWELLRDSAKAQFNDSLQVFPGEAKPSPVEVGNQIIAAEKAIAALQTAQLKYNLQITIDVHGETLTLCEAVKRSGGANRIETMWRGLTTNARSAGYVGEVRRPDEIRATATLDRETALAQTNKAAALSTALRGAIAAANTYEVDIALIGIDAKLLSA